MKSERLQAKHPRQKEKAVGNTGPLIHLAKVKALHLLKSLYELVIIPEEVKEEAVDKGREKGCADAVEIEKAIKEGWIKPVGMETPPEFQKTAKTAGLHQAETKVIYYAYKNGITALLDDEPARFFAQTLNIKTRGTFGVLIEAAKQKIITPQEAIQKLDRLTETVYITAEIYKTVRKILETNG